ncbi:hypothetical protein MIR68_008484 [Amoeboaphelidium protococcarum]|nr:hypothetical protein MIR68_008484 [Amoeboaphelidium protococcarum]KAI3643220.1 hypothetical protein MP228_012775 [Amoeboaphelidium protococcarum]KAI3644333.1 hypothetical protein MP228_010497 [Amoeboaphelidium protococcarum]
MSQDSVTKRLQSELCQLMMASVPGISAFPESDNLRKWIGTVEGADNTPYAGQTYKLSLQFTSEYPFKAPVVKFITQIYHPNVDFETGTICLDILKEEWSAIYNVQTILISIQSLLGEPNNDSPLNGQAAQLWSNKSDFQKVVKQKYEANKLINEP